MYLTRRWLLFALVVTTAALAAWRLGEWQFHRLAERKASNAIVRTNLAAPVLPVDRVMRVGRQPAATDQWRRVRASGVYDASREVVIRYQTRDGASGVDVVAPLRTESGPTLLVDRGWFATENAGEARPRDLPAPPTGEVTVVGWVRQDATGDSAAVEDLSARAVSSRTIGPRVGGQVYAGFVDAASESSAGPRPPASARPVRAELPDLGNGPHFFYGLQWWFFGLLAVGGFFYLAWDERRKLAGGSRPRPAEPRPAPRRRRRSFAEVLEGWRSAEDAALDEAERRARQEGSEPAHQPAVHGHHDAGEVGRRG